MEREGRITTLERRHAELLATRWPRRPVDPTSARAELLARRHPKEPTDARQNAVAVRGVR